jgi:fibronectin-binding autotransporter adhesin
VGLLLGGSLAKAGSRFCAELDTPNRTNLGTTNMKPNRPEACRFTSVPDFIFNLPTCRLRQEYASGPAQPHGRPRIFKRSRLPPLLLLAYLLGSIVTVQAVDATADVWNVSTNAGAWLTAGNWSLGTVPTSTQTAQFGTNPSSSPFNVGINMNGATNNGTNNQIVGAIDVTSARSNALVIGNSSTSAGGTLTLAGVTVNSVNNTIIRNNGTGLLTIQNTAGSGNQTMSLALGNPTNNIINIDNTGGVTISTAITGAGRNLTFNGAGGGILTLSGANTYSGVTTIHSGELRVTSLANVNTASSIGTGSAGGSAADLVLAGTTFFNAFLEYNGTGAVSTNRLFTLGDATGLVGSLENDASAATSTMSFTGTGSIAFGGSGSRVLNLAGSNTGNNTFAPILGDGAGGATSLGKSGFGTWIITGANTYTGGTNVAAGTLTVNSGGTLGASASGLEVDNFSSTNTILNLNVDQTVGYLQGSPGTGTATINIASGKTLTVNQSTNTTYSGVIASAGSFTKSGTGTLTLSGTNTYTGATSVLAGVLNIQNNSSLGGTTNGTSVSSGAALEIQNGINVAGEALSLNGTGVSNGGALRDISGNNLWSGGITLGSASRINCDSGNLTLVGGITGAGVPLTVGGAATTIIVITGINTSTGGTVTKDGTGFLTLSATNNYTGATTINNGTLELQNNNTTTARLTNTSSITVNSGGTLLLSASSVVSNDRINDSATMTLNANGSSTVAFKTSGLSEHGALNNTPGMGALTLQSNSIIDMGNGASVVAFANSAAQSANWGTGRTISIYNWSGTPNTGGGTDELFFGNNATGLTGAQLLEFQFFSGTGTGAFAPGAIILSTGEVVPLSAVPEPSTWIAGELSFGLLLFTQCRRCRMKRTMTTFRIRQRFEHC